ncbi:MAG TPA: 30S ribosomal protein S17 [Candidatus Dojkabacteria bacterium]|nr:30S ribosomal protein S17 [Candidatus Dojkabacteria bacterium]HQF36596.1 30S ribosomal protein S17 [Candidatus Dojkabacteria bacterium]
MAKLILDGKIVSAKMTGTVVVEVVSYVSHPIYKKKVRKTKKYLADNNGLELTEGQKVKIVENIPISKKKRWVVIK